MNALLPWGAHIYDDAYEWARAIYGALEMSDISPAQFAAGGSISYPSALYLELSRMRTTSGLLPSADASHTSTAAPSSANAG